MEDVGGYDAGAVYSGAGGRLVYIVYIYAERAMRARKTSMAPAWRLLATRSWWVQSTIMCVCVCAAYVVVRVGGSWSEQRKLMASDAAASDNYGHSVAISGNTIAVGAIKKDVGGKVTLVPPTWSGSVGGAVPCARVVRRRATLADGRVGHVFQ